MTPARASGGGGRDTRNSVGAPRYGRCHACLALAPVCVCSLESAMCADTLSPSGVPVSEDRDRDRAFLRPVTVKSDRETRLGIFKT